MLYSDYAPQALTPLTESCFVSTTLADRFGRGDSLKFIQRLSVLVLAAYVWIGLFVFVPYENWQYARAHGFRQWLFLGELEATIRAAFWPVQAYRLLRSDAHQDVPARAAATPPFNADEMSRLSLVLTKLFRVPLTESDLDEARAVLDAYTRRTGRTLTQAEYDLFIGLTKLSTDYQYELGQSLLLSWDSRTEHTTRAFRSLDKQMRQAGLREPELLERDIAYLRAAARNETVVFGKSGGAFAFSRDKIVAGMRANELARANIEKVAAILKEGVR